MKAKTFILFITIFSISILLPAQEALKSSEEEYYDFLSLQGLVERPTLGYRTLSDSEWEIPDEIKDDEENIWKDNNLGHKISLFDWNSENKNWFTRGLDVGMKLKMYGPYTFSSYNTTSPYGQNDGALWQGKGFNTSLSAGIRLEALGFELTFKPQLSFSQNQEFEYISGVNGSQYSYFVNGIDLVQRYGDTSFFNFDWGESEIRWSWYSFTIGFGTQNPWLGPAWLNPMLGSNNAGGYPKFDAGIRKTSLYLPFCDLYIGDIEGRTWVGYIKESDYFTDSANYRNGNMLIGMSASYAPSFIPGFTFGVNRIFLARYKTENLKYYLRLFTNQKLNDVYGEGEDQKASLFVNWQFPKVGFEIYGELGIDDFTSNLVTNPFHTAIYTVGVKQAIPLPEVKNRKLKSELIFEWNNFEMSQDFQLQWQYMGYYGHSKIKQGYTNNGQILGAGSGYFGNSQYLGYKLYFSRGEITLFYHRYCPNNNYIYNMAVDTDASSDSSSNTICQDYYAAYETYNGAGGKILYYFTPDFQAGLEIDYTTISCYNYQKRVLKPNFYISIEGKYSF